MKLSTYKVEAEIAWSRVYGLILAGGQSSRLFPFNKVLSDLTGQGRTLLQQAADRLTKILRKGPHSGFLSPQKMFVLTTPSFVLPMSRQLRLPSSHFFVDPARRGTWPAILWAMAHIGLKDAEATLAVTTSDHLIPQIEAFRKGVAEAIRLAQGKPALVVLAVKPSSNPQDWLGFGSFKMEGRRTAGRPQVISGFEEKPSMERARQMIHEGGWQWNAGMFFFSISTAERALQRLQPMMYEVYATMQMELRKGNMAKAKKLFERFPSKIPHPLKPESEADNTIDYAIAAPLVQNPIDSMAVYGVAGALPEWTDLGRWDVLRALVRRDSHGNVRVGHIKAGRSVRNCILVADQGCWMEVSGLQDSVAAFSNGRALVLPIAELGRVKELVAEADESKIVAPGLPAGSVSLARNRLRIVLPPFRHSRGL